MIKKIMKGGFIEKYYIYLICVIILFFIVMPIYIKFNVVDKFDNQNMTQLQYDFGIITDTTNKGTIKFKTQFNEIPYVFTQIIGNNSSVSNGYSIQIMNVSLDGFDYSKDKIIDEESGSFSITKIVPDNNLLFQWSAFLKNNVNNCSS